MKETKTTQGGRAETQVRKYGQAEFLAEFPFSIEWHSYAAGLSVSYHKSLAGAKTALRKRYATRDGRGEIKSTKVEVR